MVSRKPIPATALKVPQSQGQNIPPYPVTPTSPSREAPSPSGYDDVNNPWADELVERPRPEELPPSLKAGGGRPNNQTERSDGLQRDHFPQSLRPGRPTGPPPDPPQAATTLPQEKESNTDLPSNLYPEPLRSSKNPFLRAQATGAVNNEANSDSDDDFDFWDKPDGPDRYPSGTQHQQSSNGGFRV